MHTQPQEASDKFFTKEVSLFEEFEEEEWRYCLEINRTEKIFFVYDMIYLLTTIGLSPGGSTHLYTNNT
jgi:hypothetical protein